MVLILFLGLKVKSSSLGFTAVELLVAMVIFSILAMLLTMGLEESRERSKTAKCTSNLRAIGTALQLYAAENNHVLPTLTEDNAELAGGGGYGVLDIRFELAAYDPAVWNMSCPADPRKNPSNKYPAYISYVYYETDLAKLEVPTYIVCDGGYYHGRPGRWTGMWLYSDNHVEAKKW